jgi:hypothetical protein
MNNTLCNGTVKNNNPKSPIAYFELVTVREYDDYEGGTRIEQVKSAEDFLSTDWGAIDEPFYHVYGKRYIDDKISGPIFLGEFYSIDKAKQFLYYLTGEHPNIISY